MTISRRVNYLITAVALVFSATVASAQVEWNHNPASNIGPNFWGELTFPFATCGAGEPFVEVGKKQSPVNIVTAETVAAGLPALAFQYHATPFRCREHRSCC
jgi:carbonic anhydrase